MSLLIPTGNVGSALAGEYEVANSLRLDGSSAYLSRTFGTPTNASKFTYSGWVKRSGLSASNILLFANGGDAQNFANIMFNSGDDFFWHILSSNSEVSKLRSDAKYRDVSAWLHLVFAWDSTQATASNRTKMYVNGVELDSFDVQTNTAQDTNYHMNTAVEHIIGAEKGNTGGSVGNYFGGYMAEVVFIDGQALDPTSFGEFDSDTNIWKPKDVSGLTFGNNGFYLDFEDSSALGNDVSGNNNDFTVNNLTSVDQSTDTCTNNFSTWNPLDNYYAESTFKEGNLEVRGKSPGIIYSYETYNIATIGVSSGKWFWEVKLTNIDSGACQIGIVDNVPTSSGNQMGARAYGYAYGNGGNVKNNGSSLSGSYSSYTTGDIIGIALNLDDNELTFYKNGTVQNSGTAISITAPASTTSGFYFPAGGDENAGNVTLQANFGSPPFSISSGNSDGNGYGNFEYSVPSGYYALNSKNLAEYG